MIVLFTLKLKKKTLLKFVTILNNVTVEVLVTKNPALACATKGTMVKCVN